MPIRLIYFDLGNVIALFDHEIACQNVAALTGLAARRVREVIFTGGLEHAYERGDLSTAAFHDTFCRQTGVTIDLTVLERACSDIFRLNAPVVPLIASLRMAGYRLGILSNTCPAHWDFLYTAGRYRVLCELFDVYALSYELRSMKPEPTIYPLAARLAKTDPAEIFFVDDRLENVTAARDAGFDAVQFHDVGLLQRELLVRRVRGNY